ncbi:MAG: AI-2E family transporter [Bacteroidales bacterium]|nr:AI-2E family transporter [Bacteroidales bacterium]
MKSFVRNILIIAGVVFLAFCFWYFREIVIYILISGVLSIMGRPLVDLFGKIRIRNFELPKAISALLALLIMWGMIFLFFFIFIPLIANQIQQLSAIDSNRLVSLIEEPVRKAENLLRSVNPELENVSIREFLASKITDVLNIEFVQELVGSLVKTMGNMLVAFFSISFISFFFLKDQHLFFESIIMWVPDSYTENVTRALYSIKNLLTRYFIGIVIQSTCIMIMMTTGMTIVGIDFSQALVMGLIAGVLNVIPYVGPWLGFFITVTMGIASHLNQDFTTVVKPLVYYMAIVVAITQLTDNLVFQPVIFSNSVRAHPLEIFIVVLAAGFAAGIPGMILGIPAYTVLRVLAREFFYNLKAVQKLTSGLPDNEAIMSMISREEGKDDKE